MTAVKYSRCQFGFIWHLCTCSYLVLKVCLSWFWREVFFSLFTSSCHEEEVELWVWFLSVVQAWWQPCSLELGWPWLHCVFGGYFLVWALEMVLLCHQKYLCCHWTAWMGSALAWLVFTALKTKGMLLLVFFSPHFCLIPICIPFSQFPWSSFRNRKFYFLIPWDAAGNYY